jgi:hypothetical protein
VVAAIEDINIIVAVDPDPADLLERPAIGQLRPVGIVKWTPDLGPLVKV